ncbi:unnamed protein product [Parnassius apollo]|uniref:(apollo) hypothetical protein n=1 Tax=Parnassius apollo TaxID=110799 RepID=A0A8S3XVA3_PARAO|nr:unnamed protein product [Parnassius apollo]
MDELSVNAEKNIKAGFRKCGIVPLDANQVIARLPLQEEDEEVKKKAMNDSVLSLLKEMRYGSMNIREPQKKRKLDVVAGKSVSAEELERNEDREPLKPKKKRTLKQTNKSTPKGKGVGKKTKSKICNLQIDNGENRNCDIKICGESKEVNDDNIFEVPVGLHDPDVVIPEPFDFSIKEMPIIFAENFDFFFIG